MSRFDSRRDEAADPIKRNPANNGGNKGPLRKIVEVIRPALSRWDRALVIFECGHEGQATARAERGRCPLCKPAEPAQDKPQP